MLRGWGEVPRILAQHPLVRITCIWAQQSKGFAESASSVSSSAHLTSSSETPKKKKQRKKNTKTNKQDPTIKGIKPQY